jgi:uncharacterized membrane protein YfcA
MVIWYALSGVLGGILGGMGMGGGTLLIPLLTIFLSIGQKEAQGLNLVSFLPMATVALIMHSREGLVKWKGLLYMIIPATVSAVLGSFLAMHAEERILRVGFGIFLIALGVFFCISGLTKKENEEK